MVVERVGDWVIHKGSPFEGRVKAIRFGCVEVGDRSFMCKDLSVARRPLRVGDRVWHTSTREVRTVEALGIKGSTLSFSYLEDSTTEGFVVPGVKSLWMHVEQELEIDVEETIRILQKAKLADEVARAFMGERKPVWENLKLVSIDFGRPEMGPSQKVALARQMFDTDPDVLKFVALRSEGQDERRQKVADTAWMRNENGWRAMYEERAGVLAEHRWKKEKEKVR